MLILLITNHYHYIACVILKVMNIFFLKNLYYDDVINAMMNVSALIICEEKENIKKYMQ